MYCRGDRLRVDREVAGLPRALIACVEGRPRRSSCLPPPYEILPDLPGDPLALPVHAVVGGFELPSFHADHTADPSHSRMRVFLVLFVFLLICREK